MTSLRRLTEILVGSPQCPGETAQSVGSAALKRCQLSCGGPNLISYYRPNPDGNTPLQEQQLSCGKENIIVVQGGGVITGVRTNERGQVRLIVSEGDLGHIGCMLLPYLLDAPDALPAGKRIIDTRGQPVALPGEDMPAADTDGQPKWLPGAEPAA